MSKNSSKNALRFGHGRPPFNSTAAMVTDAGKFGRDQNPTRQRWREQGRCVTCGKERDDPTMINCTACRDRARTRLRERKEQQMATLMQERLQSADEINVARKILDDRPETKILIIGGRTTNIQREARQHPRVLCWESTELQSKNASAPIMPTSVSVVIITRFCSHVLFHNVKRQAEQRRAFVFGGFKQTGEMRHILQELLALKAATNVDKDDEADQIPEEPMPTTKTPAMQVVSTPAPAIEVVASTPAPNEEALEMRLDEAVRLVTESMDALDTARTSLGLVRDELTRTKSVIHANREQLDTLRKLKSLLGAL